MKGSKAQFDFLHNATSKINFAKGSVRSGKTFSSLLLWTKRIFTGPDGLRVMVGKTVSTLRRNCLECPNGLFDIVGPKGYRYNRARQELIVGGRTIVLVGANDEKAVEKIQGLTLADAYGDEFTLWPKNFFDMLITRLSVEGSIFVGTGNPGSPNHWHLSDYANNPEAAQDVKLFRFILDDNPSLSQEYKDRLKRLYTGLFYKRYILGLDVAAEGVIYDVYSEDRHVRPSAPNSLCRRRIGVDFAASSPTCGIELAQDTQGKNYAVDEYWFDPQQSGRQKSTSEIAKDLTTKWPGVTFVVDPSAEVLKIDLRKLGATVINAHNAVFDGIQNVANLLSKDALIILEKCVNVRREILAYAWDQKATAAGLDEPIKVNDHAMDALRYAVMANQFSGELGFVRW